jgi:hypothetical protein
LLFEFPFSRGLFVGTGSKLHQVAAADFVGDFLVPVESEERPLPGYPK